MKTYGSKGLAIFQINNDGFTQQSKPDKSGLDTWVQTYKPAGVSGIDPWRRSSKFYYDGNPTVSIPYNFILDAKTLKILEKGSKSTELPSLLAKYLP